MQYALMIRASYEKYGPLHWITHTVYDTLAAARIEQTMYEAAQQLLPGHGTTVVIYHSHEWENLVL